MPADKIVKKYIFMATGCLSLVLGLIGIFLPLLPTTPFLLLAAYCFTRSSKRLYSWLIHHRILGSYIYHYQTHRAISQRAKLLALCTLWGSLIFSSLLLSDLYARLLLIAAGTGVTLYILSLRTLK